MLVPKALNARGILLRGRVWADLLLIGKIRNALAHEDKPMNFGSREIRKYVKTSRSLRGSEAS
jgi:hypothetical protein